MKYLASLVLGLGCALPAYAGNCGRVVVNGFGVGGFNTCGVNSFGINAFNPGVSFASLGFNPYANATAQAFAFQQAQLRAQNLAFVSAFQNPSPFVLGLNAPVAVQPFAIQSVVPTAIPVAGGAAVSSFGASAVGNSRASVTTRSGGIRGALFGDVQRVRSN